MHAPFSKLRAAVSILVASVACCAAAQEEPPKVDRNAPFLTGFYQRPLPADSKEFLVASVVLWKTGQKQDAALLEQVAQRKVLKSLLGEPYQPAGTIAEAIKREVRESEAFDALRLRALTAVSVRYAPTGKLPARPGADFQHAGNGIWVLTEANRVTVHLPMMVRNGLKEPLKDVSFTIGEREGGAPKPYYLFLICKPEASPSFAPGVSQPALCSGDEHPLRIDLAIEALRKRSAPVSLNSFRVATDDTHVGTLGVSFSEKVRPSSWEVERVLAGVGCHALGTCEELQRREEARQRKADRPRDFLGLAIVGAVLVLLASLLVGPRQAKGWFVPTVATIVIASSTVAVACILGLMHSKGGGWAGIEYFIVLFYGAIPHCVGVLILAVGLLAGGLTRYRVFALGLGLLAPALVWAALATPLFDGMR